LVGSALIRLDFRYYVDAPHCTIFVDGTSEVGSAVVRVFTNLLIREFGEDSFQVERMQSAPSQHRVAAA
jgi:hypothetical protein